MKKLLITVIGTLVISPTVCSALEVTGSDIDWSGRTTLSQSRTATITDLTKVKVEACFDPAYTPKPGQTFNISMAHMQNNPTSYEFYGWDADGEKIKLSVANKKDMVYKD